MEQRRFEGLEGVRGLLAWPFVFLGHLLLRSGYSADELVWPLSAIRGGNVTPFMVLSGFVIGLMLLRRREPFGAYLLRRYLRLFPVLAACVLAVLALSWISEGRIFRFDGSLPYHLLAHTALLHSAIPEQWLANSSTALIPPAWSVSLEWQFYLVAPALIWALRRGTFTTAAIVAGLFASYALTGFEKDFQLLGRQWSYPHREALPLALHWFLAGVACALALPALEGRRFSPGPLLLAAGVTWLATRNYTVSFWILVLPAAVGHVPGLSSLLCWRPLRTLGRLSYCCYLSHVIVIKVFERTLALQYFERDTWSLFAFLAVTSFPTTLVVSHLLHRFVEQPAIRLGKHWTGGRGPARDVRPSDSSEAPGALPAPG